MGNRRKEFDEVFKRAFEVEQAQAPANGWEKVFMQLKQEGMIKRVNHIWRLRVAASILMLIGLVISIKPYTEVQLALKKEKEQQFQIEKESITLSNQVREEKKASLISTSIEQMTKLVEEKGKQTFNPTLKRKAFENANSQVQRLEVNKNNTAYLAILEQPIRYEENIVESALSMNPIYNVTLPSYDFIFPLAVQHDFTELNPYLNKQVYGNEQLTLNEEEKWSIGAGVGTEYTGAFLFSEVEGAYELRNDQNSIYSAEKKEQLSSEVNNTFGTSLQVGKMLTDKLELVGGLAYSKWEGVQTASYQVQSEQTYYRAKFVPISGPAGKDNGIGEVREQVKRTSEVNDTLKSTFSYQTVDVPFSIRIKLGRKKLSYYLSPGFSTTFSSTMDERLSSSNSLINNEVETYFFGPTRVNLLFGLGLNYAITNQLNFRLEPGFRHGIVFKNDPYIKQSFSSFGFGTSINYYF